MNVSALNLTTNNPATSPALTDALVASVNTKAAAAFICLKNAAAELKTITFANSFGAEDMVLTDIILKNQLVQS